MKSENPIISQGEKSCYALTPKKLVKFERFDTGSSKNIHHERSNRYIKRDKNTRQTMSPEARIIITKGGISSNSFSFLPSRPFHAIK
jgi:hypothetical protein